MSRLRLTVCERCGVEFSCSPGGQCWCGEEPVRLPLPKPGESEYSDCLCRDCLREVAAARAAPDKVR